MSSSPSFKMLPLLVIVSIFITCSSLVNAHGMMLTPPIRTLPGDISNGYTFARTAYSPALDFCQGLPRGQPWSQVMAPGAAQISYIITAPHQGSCKVMVAKYDSYGNIGSWLVIGTDPTCGSSAHTGQITINLPTGTYNAVLRWEYDTDNGSGEIFENCADIQVSTSGSNNYAIASADSSAFNKCTTVGDQVCTSINSPAWAECGGGFWQPKSCPQGLMCYQSTPQGNIGQVICDYPPAGVSLQTTTNSATATATNTPAATNNNGLPSWAGTTYPSATNGSPCSNVNEMLCTGSNDRNGWSQCSNTKLFVGKNCPPGLVCAQSILSNPSAGMLGAIQCVWPADLAAVVAGAGTTTTTTTTKGAGTAAAKTTTTTTNISSRSKSTTTTSTTTKKTITTTTTKKTTTTATATNTVGGPCTLGDYVCNGYGFLQCTINGWKQIACPANTRCMGVGYVYCGW